MELRPSRGGSAAVFCGLVGGLIGLVGGVLGGLIALGALSPDMAWATHEMDHRFTISGHVRDKDGKPVRDVKVSAKDLRDQTVEPATSYADGEGFYKLMLHMHNANLGDPIQISAIDERAGVNEVTKIKAEFDPKDKHSERQATVNFGLAPESSGSRAEGMLGTEEASKLWAYGVGGVLMAAAVGVAVMRARQRQASGSAKRRGKKQV